MPAVEMYDYLTTITPDYSTTTLSVNPQNVLVESGLKPSIVINEGDDLSEERIVLSSQSQFIIKLQFNILSRSDAGIIMDFYHDPAKGCGNARSFYWQAPADHDGHTYVVRFIGNLDRFYQNYLIYGYQSLTLKILGRKAD